MKEIFDKLFLLNVNEHTEKKNGLTYLSWSWAYAKFMESCPDMTYEIRHWDGKPYLYDETLGYMVETSITVDGVTKTMWLPVMDGANKAMKAEPYTYQTKFGEKHVDAATMFDINTAIMRCLVKNMALFGLGLYIYSGEDLPPTPFEPMTKEQENRLIELGADFTTLVPYLKLSSKDEISRQIAENLIKAKELKMAEA